MSILDAPLRMGVVSTVVTPEIIWSETLKVSFNKLRSRRILNLTSSLGETSTGCSTIVLFKQLRYLVTLYNMKNRYFSLKCCSCNSLTIKYFCPRKTIDSMQPLREAHIVSHTITSLVPFGRTIRQQKFVGVGVYVPRCKYY